MGLPQQFSCCMSLLHVSITENVENPKELAISDILQQPVEIIDRPRKIICSLLDYATVPALQKDFMGFRSRAVRNCRPAPQLRLLAPIARN